MGLPRILGLGADMKESVIYWEITDLGAGRAELNYDVVICQPTNSVNH